MKFFKYDINKYDPKKMMAIPAGIFGVALIIVLITFAMTGMPVTPGIDFAGGTAVTLHTTDSKEQIAAYFAGYDLKSIDEGVNNGYYLKFGPMANDQMMAFNDYILAKYPDAGIDQIGANFGSTLQSQALIAILFAFIGMAVVVFIAFRKLEPALTVVFAGIADITITAAAMNIFHIELSLATTAALLMLIGYSVDSNILLTTKVLKRQGKLAEKMAGAFHTGFIMTTTTFGALFAMFVVALIGQVPTLYNIGAVLLIGLISDLIFTWAFNAGALRLYVEKTDPRSARPDQPKPQQKNTKGAKQ
ncbi:MAG: protein translocase subunit SecF [Methanocorpusculum sp.]|nr:protein translocase subunit SecF [Methanocorpusculum sp.]